MAFVHGTHGQAGEIRFFSFLSDFRPPFIFPFTLLNYSSMFSPSSITTLNYLVFATRFISKSLRCSGFVFSYFGTALSLFIRIHSEMFLNSLWAFVSSHSMLLDVNVTCVSSAYMLALENFKHFSKSSR